MSLFPSVRMTGSVTHTGGVPAKADSSTWHLMSMLAANGAHDQWMVIVGALREKIVGDVKAAHQGVVKSPEERVTILTNIDLLLRPMQLDISQLTML